MHGQRIGADHGNEALVDFQVVDLELAQVIEAGLPGAEVVECNHHPHGMQFLEQFQGDRGGLDKLALGQLQGQYHPARREVLQEGAAVVQQAQVAAVVGGDVDPDVKAILQQPNVGREALGSVHHQRPGHGDDLPAVLGIGDEQVRANQAFSRVVPAHQHFSTGPAVIALAHHRLEVRQEFVSLQGPIQLGAGRGGAANLPAADQRGHGPQYQQQAEQGRVVAAQQLALLVGAVAALHAKRVTRRAQQHIGTGCGRWCAYVYNAVLAHPGVAHAYLQLFIRADQAQCGQQMVAIHRGDRAVVAVAGAVHQQRMPRGDRVAVHQPQLAVGVVAGVDRLVELAEQRGAIKGVVPEQVGRAHEGIAGDLGTQRKLDLVARAGSQGSSALAARDRLSRMRSTCSTAWRAVAWLLACISRSTCQFITARPHNTGSTPTTQGSRLRQLRLARRLTVRGMRE